MPLPISYSEDLRISRKEFDNNGLAVVTLSGGRYGGDWKIVVSVRADGESLGMFETQTGPSKAALEHDPNYPLRAIETGFIWLTNEAVKHNWRVVQYKNFNDRYAAAERPYFCLAQAVVANEQFTPMPGVTYADEMTLDAVMSLASVAD